MKMDKKYKKGYPRVGQPFTGSPDHFPDRNSTIRRKTNADHNISPPEIVVVAAVRHIVRRNRAKFENLFGSNDLNRRVLFIADAVDFVSNLFGGFVIDHGGLCKSLPKHVHPPYSCSGAVDRAMTKRSLIG